MRMVLLALLLFSGVVVGKPATEDTFGAWVPEGWTLFLQAMGDLDKDGGPDVVLVLEEDNPLNRKGNDYMGPAELNLNPRRLLVLFGGEAGYRPVLSVDHFLPSQHDEETPCLDDPLSMGGVEVKRGLLEVSLHYWLSCGSYAVSNRTFKFRYQEGRFRLIGLDTWGFMRNSGERTERSINFLTGKRKVTTGLNEFEESRPVVRWESVDAGDPLFIDAMSPSCWVDGKVQIWCE